MSAISGEKNKASPGQAGRDESRENGGGADGDAFRPSMAGTIDRGNS